MRVKSPKDVGISGAALEPLLWVVEELVGPLLFFVVGEGDFSELRVSCDAVV